MTQQMGTKRLKINFDWLTWKVITWIALGASAGFAYGYSEGWGVLPIAIFTALGAIFAFSPIFLMLLNMDKLFE